MEDGRGATGDRKVIGSRLRFNRITAMASRKLSAHGATSRGGSKLNISIRASPTRCAVKHFLPPRLRRISIGFPRLAKAPEHSYFYRVRCAPSAYGKLKRSIIFGLPRRTYNPLPIIFNRAIAKGSGHLCNEKGSGHFYIQKSMIVTCIFIVGH